jgi:hypothetical protein
VSESKVQRGIASPTKRLSKDFKKREGRQS